MSRKAHCAPYRGLEGTFVVTGGVGSVQAFSHISGDEFTSQPWVAYLLFRVEPFLPISPVAEAVGHRNIRHRSC